MVGHYIKRTPLPILVAATVFLTSAIDVSADEASHDAFTFQGQLKFDNDPVAGPVNLAFRLYDAEAGGPQVGIELLSSGFEAFDDDGRFTIDLAFGKSVFDGTPLWLEVEVDGQVLSPRQPIMPTPYSVRSLNVTAVADGALAGTYSNPLSLSNPGNMFNGAFVGSGAGLTGLDASNVTTGTLGSSILSGNYGNALSFSNPGNTFTGAFSGSGASLTGLNATNIDLGNLDAARMPVSGSWTLSSNLDVGPGMMFFAPSTQRIRVGNFGAIDAKLTVAGEEGQDAFRVRAGGTTRLVVRPNGGVGIGSNFSVLPDAGLRVAGDVALGTDTPAARLHVERASSSSFPQVRIHSSTNNGFGRLRLSTEGHESHWDIAAGGSNHHMDFFNSASGSVLTLRAEPNRVGIGTISPIAPLHIVNADEQRGLFVDSTATSGVRYAVFGQTASSIGVGVRGEAASGTGASFGVMGRAMSTSGTGVLAEALASTGTTYGVQAYASSSNGRAVYGHATSISGNGIGVYGRTNSSSGHAGYFQGGRNYFSGNVGIGTEDPAYALDVVSSARIGDELRIGSGPSVLSIENDFARYQGAGTFALRSDQHLEVKADNSLLLQGALGATLQGLVTNIAAADRVRINNTALVVESSTGRVGLGLSFPGLQLHLSQNSAGKPTSNTWTVTSDRRLKKNISTIGNALNDLLALRGVTYQWIDPSTQGDMDGTYTGFIAQEIEEVFPEWIDEGPDGFKRLTVIGFEGIVVEALRELRAEKDVEIDALHLQYEAEMSHLHHMVEAQQSHIDSMRSELDALRAAVEQLTVQEQGVNE